MNTNNSNNIEVKSQNGENVQNYDTPVLQQLPSTPAGPTTVVYKVKNRATPLLLLVIVLLFGACYYMNYTTNQKIYYYEHKYSPINTTKSVDLELNSYLVKDLYSTIKTDIREDVADPYFDNQMKLYLAYRNIANGSIFNSNCNMFNNTSMQSITCVESDDFTPKAFKIDTITNSINRLFGETSGIHYENIQLGHSCLGGYQYMPGRDEFVQGNCTVQSSIIYTADKQLVKATSTGSQIVLEEKVLYSNPTGGAVPDVLKSGIYHHTFRLDKNYNYIYENKELVEERG